MLIMSRLRGSSVCCGPERAADEAPPAARTSRRTPPRVRSQVVRINPAALPDAAPLLKAVVYQDLIAVLTLAMQEAQVSRAVSCQKRTRFSLGVRGSR